MAEEVVSIRTKLKKQLTLRNVAIGLLVYLALKLCGVFQFYGPYWGRVVDADTRQPIAGAGVLAKYVRYTPILSGPKTVGVQETFTDEDGYFFVWPRLVLDIAIPFSIFRWSPEMAIVKEKYEVAGTEFTSSEHKTFFTVYGFNKRAPTIIGPMIVGLQKLKPEYSEYRKYESALSTSTLDLGPSGFLGIILGPMKSAKFLKFTELARQERHWANHFMQEMEKNEFKTQDQESERTK